MRTPADSNRTLLGLMVLVAALVGGAPRTAQASGEPRALYTYSFGGLEDKDVDDAVALLDCLGYAGIAAEARGEEALARLDEYHAWSDARGEDFEVVSAFMAHRFDTYGFSDAGHRAAIDRLAGREGSLWVWVRDTVDDGSITNEMVESFITGIFEYALSKGVRVVLYPHYNTWYPTVDDALPLVEAIDHPSFGIAVNLCHELMSDKGEALEQTFANARGRIAAVILSGSLIELDRTSVRTMNESTIRSLDDSPYDLRPYMELIRDSGFEGPVGFINFNIPSAPEDYLVRTMTRWRELCLEIGLFEPGPSPAPLTLRIKARDDAHEIEWSSEHGKLYDLLSSLDPSAASSTWTLYDDGVTTYEDVPASGTGETTLSGISLRGARRYFVMAESSLPCP